MNAIISTIFTEDRQKEIKKILSLKVKGMKEEQVATQIENICEEIASQIDCKFVPIYFTGKTELVFFDKALDQNNVVITVLNQ